jgi:hypothetical protein
MEARSFKDLFTQGNISCLTTHLDLVKKSFFGSQLINVIMLQLQIPDLSQSYMQVDDDYIFPLLERYNMYSPLFSVMIYEKMTNCSVDLPQEQELIIQKERDVWTKLKQAYKRNHL